MSDSVSRTPDDRNLSFPSPASAAAVPAGTFSQAYGLFLTASAFARRTREGYALDLAPPLSMLGAQSVAALTLEQIQQFLVRQEHLAPATYNRRPAAVRSFCRWLGRQGWFVEDLLGGDAGVETLQLQTTLGQTREIFFSRKVATALDKYLITRSCPTNGPLFITHS
ncbi:MAG: site-specific integrase [Ktedonobacterales bacterium]